jgi:two-component system nitrogen regulation response regulator GlnG
MQVIILSAQNTLDTAVRASETGAFEYFPKPFDLEELVRTVRQALGSNEAADLSGADDELGQALPLVGRSPAMQAVYRMITRVLRNDLTVLILGDRAPARNSWPKRSTSSAAGAKGRSWRSTRQPFRTS